MTDSELVIPAMTQTALDFDTLAAQAVASIEGFDLTRDKKILLGVPFAIVGVVYRDGVKPETNYVSLEVVTASETVLAERVKRGLVIEPVRVGPNETLVFNDGSTGIARQITAFLHTAGIVDIGEINFEGGPMGESSYDRYRTEWVRGGDEAEKGFRGRPLLMCPRGLRESAYEFGTNDTEATTFYLA